MGTLTTITDSDELLKLHEEALYNSLSPKQIQAIRARKRCEEEIAVCKQMLRQWGMLQNCFSNSLEIKVTRRGDNDDESSRRDVVLCCASALDGLRRTIDATTLLESYLGMIDTSSSDDEEEEQDQQSAPRRRQRIHDDIPSMLALAKLYFKVQENQKSLDLCTSVQNYIRQQQVRSKSSIFSADASVTTDKDDMFCCSLEDVSDAFHLAGWVFIHADDHTSAYRIWSAGSVLSPTCSVLKTQTRKRRCWDDATPDDEEDSISDKGCGMTSFDASSDFDAFSVPLHLRSKCPALALFDKDTQQHQLVFRTKEPILSSDECARVLRQVQLFHSEHPRNGKWSTVRHSSVKTTDVAVEDIPSLRPWLRSFLAERLYPMLRCAYPKLADGSDLGKKGERMRVHDAFIVRYDAECDMSLSLPEHSDTSVISFTVPLNQQGQDFEGGGTWFESISIAEEQEQEEVLVPTHTGAVLNADRGQAVAFAGPLRHAGYPVTKGCRIILVLFLYAEDFAYGKFLKAHVEEHGQCCNTFGNNTTHGSNNPAKENDNGRLRQQEHGSASSDDDDGLSAEDAVLPSGDRPGGFVVYNQTVELVSMLNRGAASVLDC
jgi:hypothetical protein